MGEEKSTRQVETSYGHLCRDTGISQRPFSFFNSLMRGFEDSVTYFDSKLTRDFYWLGHLKTSRYPYPILVKRIMKPRETCSLRGSGAFGLLRRSMGFMTNLSIICPKRLSGLAHEQFTRMVARATLTNDVTLG